MKKTAFAAALGAAWLVAAPALADWHGGGHGGGWHEGWHGGSGIYFYGGPGYYAYPYYSPYYTYPSYPYYADPYAPPAYGAPMPNNPYCREYRHTIIVDGQPRPAFGTACQQPDGTWKVIN